MRAASSVDGDLRGLARGDRLCRAFARQRDDGARAASAIAAGSSPLMRRSNSAASYAGSADGRLRSGAFQSCLGCRALFACIPQLSWIELGNLEGRMRPAQRLARGRRLRRSPSGAPCTSCVPAIDRARPCRSPCGSRTSVGRCRLRARVLRGRASTAIDVVAVHAAHHVPAVGGKTRRRVVGEPALDVAVDRRCRCRRRARSACPGRACPPASSRLVRDAFHQVAVADEHVGAVIDDRRGRAG